MFKLSAESLVQYNTLHPDLQLLLTEAIKYYDFKIIEGFRGKVKQEKAFKSGNSKARWLESLHNHKPSRAVDIAPWPIDWSDNPKAIQRFVFMQGIIFILAKQLKIEIRQGLDWDSDNDMRDEKFRDYPHIELEG